MEYINHLNKKLMIMKNLELILLSILGITFIVHTFPFFKGFYDGYRDARRAYNSSDLDDCQYYARKAYRHASYAESEASSCN